MAGTCVYEWSLVSLAGTGLNWFNGQSWESAFGAEVFSGLLLCKSVTCFEHGYVSSVWSEVHLWCWKNGYVGTVYVVVCVIMLRQCRSNHRSLKVYRTCGTKFPISHTALFVILLHSCSMGSDIWWCCVQQVNGALIYWPFYISNGESHLFHLERLIEEITSCGLSLAQHSSLMETSN